MKSHKNFIIVYLFLFFCYGTVFCSYNKILLRRQQGMYLVKSVIKTEQAISEAQCGSLCSRVSSCASVNYKKSGLNQGMCELNDKLVEECEENRRVNYEFDYLEVVKSVSEIATI